MSKIEAGRLRLTLEDLRLDEIISEAMRVMSIKADEKRLTVVSEIAPGFIIQSDRRALKQIVLNLLSNAIKFTEEGGRVAVRARMSRNAALLLIEDSGIGIPREALKKVNSPRPIRDLASGSLSPNR
jgi:two-component system cell cycle sensor histidine kinase PleC